MAGVNFPDTLIVEGKYQFRPDPPFSPGAEGVGRVLATGEGVDVAHGSRVIAAGVFGSFAQQWLVAADQLVPVPDWLDPQRAAGFGVTYGTSLHALRDRAELRAGETLLVLGAAGGVGSAAVDIGKAIGARVIAAAGSEEKLEYLRRLGADETVNYRSDNLREAVKTLTGGRGVDVVVDPVGGHLTEVALRSTAIGGRLLVVGFASGDIPKVPLNLPLLKGSSIVGVFFGQWAMRDPSASASNFRWLLAAIKAGDLNPHIHGVYEFEDHAAALAEITTRRAMGKVLLQVPS